MTDQLRMGTMAKIIQVIEAEITRGNGRDTILRPVKQYWSLEGELLAECDPCPDDRVEQDR